MKIAFSPSNLAQWGLLFDLAGVLLLFRFGLPSKIEDENGPGLAVGASNDELNRIRKKNKRVKVWAYFGLACIFLGFALQYANYF